MIWISIYLGVGLVLGVMALCAFPGEIDLKTVVLGFLSVLVIWPMLIAWWVVDKLRGGTLLLLLCLPACQPSPTVPEPDPPVVPVPPEPPDPVDPPDGTLACILWAVEDGEKIEVGRGYWVEGELHYNHVIDGVIGPVNPDGLTVDVIEWPR